jgi:large subunit ribosomal protein L10
MPSAKILAKKQDEVKKMVDMYKDAKTIVITDYLGLTVAQDTALRAGFRAQDVEYKVQKNRILLLALKEIGIKDAQDLLQGPSAIASSKDDYVLPAKLCADAERKYKAFEIKGGIMEGRVVTADDIKALANLPSKEELVGKVLGGLNAPIYGFVNVLAANLRGFARVISAIAEKKGSE